ncbi:MAG TPA: TolC family outer membrane protein [Caulobacteraceae bacterium]|nr:TolC family outer membrane protein [Caulobacteraceae bacterium]
MVSRIRPAWALLILAALAADPAASSAETLADAIALAYQSNPTLQAARAQQRALDETYVQAQAGYRPTAELQLEPQYSKIQQLNALGQKVDPFNGLTGTAVVALNQPIYSGGKTTNAVKAASQDIAAGREGLRALEAQVLQSVVQAYEDVRRDEVIVSINQDQVVALQKHLDDARARFKAGEITRTDVEQSEANVQQARADLSLAQGQLQISRSSYVAAVGQNPGQLAPEPPLPGLPANVDEAFDLAESHNANLIRAENAEKASAARIAEAKAAYRPTVSVGASYGYTGVLTPWVPNQFEREAQVGVFVTQPLLTGGVTASNIRQAIENNNSDRINIETARRAVVQAVSQAWSQVLANRASAKADEQALATSRLYFADTLEEYKVGQRSTLDVIVGEQTLTNSQVALAQARHDTYLAETALLNAVGRLEADYLLSNQPTYDAVAAFRRVSRAGGLPWEGVWRGIDAAGAPGRGRIRPIGAPALASRPHSLEGPPIPEDAAPVDHDPTAPLPHTTSPDTPARVDSTRVLSDPPS